MVSGGETGGRDERVSRPPSFTVWLGQKHILLCQLHFIHHLTLLIKDFCVRKTFLDLSQHFALEQMSHFLTDKVRSIWKLHYFTLWMNNNNKQHINSVTAEPHYSLACRSSTVALSKYVMHGLDIWSGAFSTSFDMTCCCERCTWSHPVHTHKEAFLVMQARREKQNKFPDTMRWDHAAATFFSQKQTIVTWVQSVLCVPESDAIAMEILFSQTMNFKLHVHLPVLQVTRLWSRKRRTVSFLQQHHCV